MLAEYFDSKMNTDQEATFEQNLNTIIERLPHKSVADEVLKMLERLIKGL